MKVFVACGNGMGTSMLIKIKAQQAFKKVGLDASFDHGTVGEATSSAGSYDIVFCPMNFVSHFKGFEGSSVKIIGLKNPLDQNEMVEELRENGFIE